MTSDASPQCFPSQKIQTGSPFCILYQCFSLFGCTPPLSSDVSSTLCLFNHYRRLFIKASISQFSQSSSVGTISGLTCGILLRVDIMNSLSMSANFTTLQDCYLCWYVWIDHFQQIAEFLFCANRFVFLYKCSRI